jgi:hypothetical protein
MGLIARVLTIGSGGKLRPFPETAGSLERTYRLLSCQLLMLTQAIATGMSTDGTLAHAMRTAQARALERL